MSPRDASRTILGALCVLMISNCGPGTSSGPGSAGDRPASGWAEVAARDGRIRGLLEESRDQLTRTEDGFVSRVERDRRRPLTVHFDQRADGVHAVRVAGARRLSVGVRSVGARSIPGELDHGRVVYHDAFPSTDAIGMATSSLYEELWVLRGEDAPETFGWQLTPDAGLRGPERKAGGTAVYRDRLGRALLRVGGAYAIDAAGGRHPVAMEWGPDGREVTFRLDHHGLPHPVVIDPAITAVPRWTEMNVSSGPIPRSAAGLACSSWDGALTLFGGLLCAPPSCPLLHDLWRYDATGWTSIPASGPPGLAYVAFYGDEHNSRLRLYGGWDGTTVSNDEWTFSGGTWTSLNTNGGASAREGLRVVWNAAETRLVLFGGQTPFALPGFTFESIMGAGTFSQTADVDQPPVRRDFGMVYDAGAQRTLIFGGRGCLRGQPCVAPFSDTWQRSSGAWTEVSTTGTPPDARWGHGMAYDTARGVAIVFGGRNQTATLGDTWELSGDEWSQTVASGDGPPPRAHAAMAYDATRNVTVLFGGQPDPVEPEASTNQLGDTWEYATVDLSCTTGAECDTGFCVDGACCDVASCGVCESCATNEAPGSCAPVTGADPDSCADTCENGTCGKNLGAACTQGTECLGGICGGGYCCSTACDGPCETCASGTCVPTPDGTASGACATTLCDGVSGDCPDHCLTTADCVSGLACDAATNLCVKPLGSTCTDGAECQGGTCSGGLCCPVLCQGACESCTTGACSLDPAGTKKDGCPTACDGVSPECPYHCATTADCAPGLECQTSTGLCLPGLGAPCTGPQDCLSGFCSDGVCCDTACDQPCDTCSTAKGALTDGVCAPAPSGSPGEPACGGGTSCDGVSATCVDHEGCHSSSDCDSGVCIESRCCASLYDCGTKCSDDGSAMIEVATNVSTPCQHGCFLDHCAAGPVDCRISLQCPSGHQCSASGECVEASAGEPFDPATPAGCLCRTTATGSGTSSGGGVALSMLALGLAWVRRRSRRSWAFALAGMGALLTSAGCSTYEAESGEPCRQAGYSIAARVQACTGDDALANATYERFVADYTCRGPADQPQSYQCAADLRDATCDTVADYGTNLDRWATSTPACLALLSGVTTYVDVCFEAAQAIAPKVAACGFPERDYITVFTGTLDELGKRGCQSRADFYFDNCRKSLEPMPCDSVADPTSALAWATSNPSCSDLLGAP